MQRFLTNLTSVPSGSALSLSTSHQHWFKWPFLPLYVLYVYLKITFQFLDLHLRFPFPCRGFPFRTAWFGWGYLESAASSIDKVVIAPQPASSSLFRYSEKSCFWVGPESHPSILGFGSCVLIFWFAFVNWGLSPLFGFLCQVESLVVPAAVLVSTINN